MDFTNRRVAGILSLLAILVVTPFSIHNSFQKKQEKLDAIYYSTPNIATDLNQRAASAYNLSIIANRYQVLTDEMLACADALKEAPVSEAREYNQQLQQFFMDCKNQLFTKELSERDSQYVLGIESEFMASNDRIKRSEYHQLVQITQEELNQFPAHFLQKIFGFTLTIY